MKPKQEPKGLKDSKSEDLAKLYLEQLAKRKSDVLLRIRAVLSKHIYL
ncbi:MAG: hypothetical protein ACFNJO_01495 [Porphyromonas endodontalis]